MTIKDLCDCIVSELQITFDEDSNNGQVDVIIPVTAEPKEILGDTILNAEVHLILADDDKIIVSTATR